MVSSVQPIPRKVLQSVVASLQLGGLLIERKGHMQVNHDGKVVLRANEMPDGWRVILGDGSLDILIPFD